MLSIDLQARIFKEYHTGKEFTNGRKYRYTLQYNPLALVHTWVIRQDKSGGAGNGCIRFHAICNSPR